MFFQKGEVLVHFIGIGGIGMSGIAEVLISFGHRVSGSDASASDSTAKLQSLGAQIFVGHHADNITTPAVVVYSSAIKEDNPEMVRAREKNIPLMRRAEMLGEIMRLKHGLAVAGTHGKTTTTSCLATILQECGVDPTYIIGGIPRNLKGHAKVGQGDWLVAEADESDGSFLLLSPIMSVITNIDNDHMDYYKTEEKLLQAFVDFANRVPFYGRCAVNRHDPKLMQIRPQFKRPSVTFGIEDGTGAADYEARNVRYAANQTVYSLYHKGNLQVEIEINIPGTHNVLNSLGAISIAHGIGLEFKQIASAIQKFEGVGRRFQILHSNDALEVIDDYGHHPTEIQKTLETAKKTRPDRKIVLVFEPHRYTRTRDCWDQFLHCFNSADEVFLCPIYPASETPIDGITCERLAADINRLHPEFVKTLGHTDDLRNVLKQYACSKNGQKTTVLALGAGSIGKKIREHVKGL